MRATLERVEAHMVHTTGVGFLAVTSGGVVWGVLSQGVKRPTRDAIQSPPFSTEFETVWSYT
jgi:hypothetical protein